MEVSVFSESNDELAPTQLITRPFLQIARRDVLIIIAAALSVLVYAAGTANEFGFPLDDSWIHQTYGRNLAQTGQWAFIPGLPSAGSTSPLYTVLLAVGYALGVQPLLWAHLLGAAALALGGLVGARMARNLFPDVPNVDLWTGLALVVAWHLVWAATSGMETQLFGTFTLVVIDQALHQIDSAASIQRRFSGGVVFGLAGAALIATRPEGMVLVGIVGLMMLVTRPQPDTRHLLAWIGGAAIGGLVGLAPYAALNLSLNGTLLPNTFSAKQAENAPLLALPFTFNLWAMLQPLTAGGQLLLVPGVIAAIMHYVRKRYAALYLVPLLWSAALLLLYVVRLPAPYQHGRYVMPALPTFIVIGVGGTLMIVSNYKRSLMGRIFSRSLAITTLLMFGAFWWLGAQIFAKDVSMINSDMVVSARWLRDNIPPGHLLAVHDIGATGYFASSIGQPRPILDLAGLVSPEVIPLFGNPAGMLDLMRQRGVRYLMVLPPQWNDLWQGEPQKWATQFCLRFNANGGMGGMAIYEYVEGGQCKA